jgi:hypothetical protein
MVSGRTVEDVRADYRPQRILTLFVGESAPHSGKFFYLGNTPLKRYMQQALGLDGVDDFLDCFKAMGWYLDDLVLTPIDHIENRAERMAMWKAAQPSLAKRIKEYRPQAILPFVSGIVPVVKAVAGSVPVYPMPFPGHGHQRRFLEEMRRILPLLPKSSDPSGRDTDAT